MKKLMLMIAVTGFAISANAGSYLSPNPWPTNRVPVCFDSKDKGDTTLSMTVGGVKTNTRKALSSWTPQLKERVKSVIDAEYSIEKTGVQFIGWKDCRAHSSDEPVAHIFVSVDDANIMSRSTEYGRSSIGVNSQYRNVEDQDPFVYFQHPRAIAGDFKLKGRNGNADLYWEAVIIHEFGHLAGLLHEHEHQEIANDPLCQKRFGKDLSAILDQIKDITYISLQEYDDQDSFHMRIQHGPYDSSSIMNYCYIDQYREVPAAMKIRMSEQDRSTLKEIYSNQ